MSIPQPDDTGLPFDERRTPFGPVVRDDEVRHPLTLADAIRHCRWIGMDIGADEFALFFVGPSFERARLMPCFDSSYPKVSLATKFLAGSNGEDIAKHGRVSTVPCWWSDDGSSPCATAFAALEFASRVAELVPGSPGIAFPVFADRGQSGVVVFLGHRIAIDSDQVLHIHGRCFALFGAVAQMRPSEAGRLPSVSKRELECLKLTAKGYTSEDIAAALKLSVHTANQYLTSSSQKLNAVNRMQAVAKAMRLGLIE